jgi:hypothetical protein
MRNPGANQRRDIRPCLHAHGILCSPLADPSDFIYSSYNPEYGTVEGIGNIFGPTKYRVFPSVSYVATLPPQVLNAIRTDHTPVFIRYMRTGNGLEIDAMLPNGPWLHCTNHGTNGHGQCDPSDKQLCFLGHSFLTPLDIENAHLKQLYLKIDSNGFMSD